MSEPKMPSEITGHFHPTVIVSPATGKTYIVPQWIEVPTGTTIWDALKIWKKTESKIPKTSDQLQTFKIKSSDGLRDYIVTFQHGVWSCTCARYGFKKSCKHINGIKLGTIKNNKVGSAINK